MTRLTIVTDGHGKLIGAVHGHELSEKRDRLEVHVSFKSGHKLHKVDVDIDLTAVGDPAELERKLASHIPKS